MLIDSHCHVQFAAFSADWEAVIDRALEKNIWLINVGTQKDTSQKAVEISSRYPEGVYAAVGLHPIHTARSFHDEKELGGPTGAVKGFVSKGEEFDREYYKDLAMCPKVIAIGEVGLDYYRRPSEYERKVQKETFRKFIDLAAELDKPIMIHCRDAYQDLLAVLDAKREGRSGQPGGIVHSFTENWDTAQEFIRRGFYLGLNGIITFADSYNEVVIKAPLDKILLETDAPFLTPVPHRGKRNEPGYVIEVAKKIAELKNISIEEVAEQTTINCKKLFNI